MVKSASVRAPEGIGPEVDPVRAIPLRPHPSSKVQGAPALVCRVLVQPPPAGLPARGRAAPSTQRSGPAPAFTTGRAAPSAAGCHSARNWPRSAESTSASTPTPPGCRTAGGHGALLPALKLHRVRVRRNCRFALTQSESSGPALTTGATTAIPPGRWRCSPMHRCRCNLRTSVPVRLVYCVSAGPSCPGWSKVHIRVPQPTQRVGTACQHRQSGPVSAVADLRSRSARRCSCNPMHRSRQVSAHTPTRRQARPAKRVVTSSPVPSTPHRPGSQQVGGLPSTHTLKSAHRRPPSARSVRSAARVSQRAQFAVLGRPLRTALPPPGVKTAWGHVARAHGQGPGVSLLVRAQLLSRCPTQRYRSACHGHHGLHHKMLYQVRVSQPNASDISWNKGITSVPVPWGWFLAYRVALVVWLSKFQVPGPGKAGQVWGTAVAERHVRSGTHRQGPRSRSGCRFRHSPASVKRVQRIRWPAAADRRVHGGPVTRSRTSFHRQGCRSAAPRCVQADEGRPCKASTTGRSTVTARCCCAATARPDRQGVGTCSGQRRRGMLTFRVLHRTLAWSSSTWCGRPLNKSGSPSHTCVAPVMVGGGGGVSTVNCTRSVACPQLFITVTSTSCVPAVLKDGARTAVFAEPGVPSGSPSCSR